MNGDVNEVGGGKRATKRRMSAVSNEDSGEGTKRPATGFTMSIDERNELRMLERKGEDHYNYFSNLLSLKSDVVRFIYRMFSAQNAVTEKVTTVVEREFAVSVTDKEKEIFEIDRRLLQLKKALHLVRYGAVTNYYALTVDKVMKHASPKKFDKIGEKLLSLRLGTSNHQRNIRMYFFATLLKIVMNEVL